MSSGTKSLTVNSSCRQAVTGDPSTEIHKTVAVTAIPVDSTTVVPASAFGPQAVEHWEQEKAGAAEDAALVDTAATAEPTQIEGDSNLLSELLQKYPDAPPIHPLANLFPFLSREDFDQLVGDIRSQGLRNKISLVDGQILDGRTRYFACREACQEPMFEEWVGSGNLVRDVISLNLIRRHLNESQRAMLAAKLLPILEQQIVEGKKVADPNQNGANLHRNKKAATKQAAEQMNVSKRTVQHAEKVMASGRADLIAQVEAGKLAVSRAEKQLSDSSSDLVTGTPLKGGGDKIATKSNASLNQSPVPMPDNPKPEEAVKADGADVATAMASKEGSSASSASWWPGDQLQVSWPELDALVQKANNLINNPPKKVFDPDTEKHVERGDPDYKWTPEYNADESERVAFYLYVIVDLEKQIAGPLKVLRRKKRTLESYQSRLQEDTFEPATMRVKKKQATADKTVQDDQPPEPVEMEGA
jgi:hypothetical protein